MSRTFVLSRLEIMGRGKYRKLDLVVASLQRRFGPRAIYRYERPAAPALPPHIPTGFGELDQALGIGGIPRGQITEILGPATSGKVTLVAKVIAQAQDGGHQAAWVDLGWTLDADYLHRCEVDLKGLLVVRPHNGEEALTIASSLAADDLGILIFDEITSLKGQNLSPALLQGALARMHQMAIRSSCAVILLTTTYFGPPGDAANYPPGFPLGHHAAIRLALKRETWIRRHGDVRGYQASVTILKNRLAPPAGPVRIKIAFNGTVRGNGL
jgi:recombination protein RecA